MMVWFFVTLIASYAAFILNHPYWGAPYVEQRLGFFLSFVAFLLVAASGGERNGMLVLSWVALAGSVAFWLLGLSKPGRLPMAIKRIVAPRWVNGPYSDLERGRSAAGMAVLGLVPFITYIVGAEDRTDRTPWFVWVPLLAAWPACLWLGRHRGQRLLMREKRGRVTESFLNEWCFIRVFWALAPTVGFSLIAYRWPVDRLFACLGGVATGVIALCCAWPTKARVQRLADCLGVSPDEWKVVPPGYSPDN